MRVWRCQDSGSHMSIGVGKGGCALRDATSVDGGAILGTVLDQSVPLSCVGQADRPGSSA
jgi:hypothetical protein